jgi:hypothetical protein
VSERLATYWLESMDGESLGNLGTDRVRAVAAIADELDIWLSEAKDGDEFTFTVGRKDMTQEQIDAIPEI